MFSPTPTRSRREFLKRSSTALAALGSLSAGASALHGEEKSKKMRVALVGTGGRGLGMWGPALVKEFGDRLEMVGICDVNPKRVAFARTKFKGDVPAYTDFDRMVKETKPDAVIVTTVDKYHAQYVVRALELGCDAICEKPFGTTAEHCQAMHDAEERTGGKIIVTFNARYFPEKTRVKELLTAGEIGDLYSVSYAEMLDLSHGASYFRRWHGIKDNSGTLLLTKASHHFDQLNWWVDSDPEEVMAYGDLKKYGRNGPFRSTHCRACSHKNECKFYWDITKSKHCMDLYVAAEKEDGYLRDGCLYRKEIDIYDTMTLQCKYANGVLMTYSLDATCPIEGQIITLNGSKGRIELRVFHRQPWKPEHRPELRLIKNWGGAKIVDIQKRAGGHGGADPALKEHIFNPDAPDPLKHRAGSRAGIMSSMIGIAGYTSIETGRPTRIKDLVDV